ncbi:MAG: hypothetical protein V5A45_10125 [Haloarculaceae archaeon]
MGDDGGDSANDGLDTAASTDGTTNGTAPFLFLLGLVGVLGSLVAFLADLWTGYDILRSLLINAASVALLVWWAATDTLTDPESSVDSRGGAAGTGLLLLGLYLVCGAAVVGVTSLVHDRFDIVPWAAGLGILLVVAGFVVLPRKTILTADGDDEPATTTGEEPDS